MSASQKSRRSNDTAPSATALRAHLLYGTLMAGAMFVAGCGSGEKSGNPKTSDPVAGKPSPANPAGNGSKTNDGNKSKSTNSKPKKKTGFAPDAVKAVDLARMFDDDREGTEKKFADGPIQIVGRIAQLDMTRGGFYLYGTSETMIRCIVSRDERRKIADLHFGQTVLVEGSPSFISRQKGTLAVRSCSVIKSKPYTTPEHTPADVSVFNKAHVAVFKTKSGQAALDALAELAKWSQPRGGRPVLFEGEVQSSDFIKATEARFNPMEAVVFNKTLNITVRCRVVSRDLGESLEPGDKVRLVGSSLTVLTIKDKRELVLLGCLAY